MLLLTLNPLYAIALHYTIITDHLSSLLKATGGLVYPGTVEGINGLTLSCSPLRLLPDTS